MELTPTNITQPLPAASLTKSQEDFAAHYVAFGDPVAAYLHAYNPATTKRSSLQQLAYRVRSHPKVAARIRALRNAQAATDEAVSAARLIADLEAIAYADPRELMALTVVNCRWCWGTGYAYQFRDDRELADACGKACAEHRPLPDMAGGVGFRGDRAPNAECPRCDGHGLAVPRFSDTADASPAAAALFKGLEMHADGTVKRVILHDQMALRTELHKLKGMHVDRSINVNLNADLKPLKRGMSVEEAVAIMETLVPTLPAPDDPNDPSIVGQQ